MKALVVEAAGIARIRDIPAPSCGSDDALVKIRRAGICGTDYSIFTGKTSFVSTGQIVYPVRIGHEWSGDVAAVGSAVKGFRPGDRVTGDNIVSCGHCEACLRGDYDGCDQLRCVGTIRCWDGCFAEYMLMPARHLYKLPDSISYDNAALLEPMSIAHGAIDACGAPSGGACVVIGTGAIGLSAVALLSHAGASPIVLVGRNELKLRVGKRLGATHTCAVGEARALLDSLSGGRGAHRLIEATGSADCLALCLNLAGERAHVALVGFYEGDVDGLPLDLAVTRQLTLCGVMGSVHAMRSGLALLTQGIDLSCLITRRVEFADAVEALAERDRNGIKTMIEFPS